MEEGSGFCFQVIFLADGRGAIFRAPWLIYFPGFAIFITITCYNLVGEAFRDAADPRLRDGTS